MLYWIFQNEQLTEIRNYKKLESIGSGAFGAVYKVENISNKKM